MSTTHDTDIAPEELRVAVGGMTCAGCAAGIQRGISMLDGVEVADVNIATRRATVRPDGTIDPDELRASVEAAIEGLGYQVLRKGASPAAEQSDDSDDSADSGGHHDMSMEDEHAAHLQADAGRIADYRRRFVLAAVLTAPLMAVSMIEALQFPAWEFLALTLATPVILWCAWPFHRSTVASARHGMTNMDTLVTLGTGAAWLWSVAVVSGAPGHVYFETGAVIVTLILLGKWLEVRSTARAGDALRALGKLQVDEVTLEDGTVISRDELEEGMRFVVKPGGTIATDGTVVDGEAAVNAAMVTGESVPERARPGDEVIGGTVATDGALTVEATRVGSATMLAQIADMVDRAQAGKANAQRLADRISAVFVPVVIALSVAALAGWFVATGDADRAFTAAVAVLIISCPCALGLATPLAIMVGVGRAAQLGVLVGGPQVFEDTRRVDTVVFDKTGTLTAGQMTLADSVAPRLDEPGAAALATAVASVEARSEHPIAAALAAATDERWPLKDFRSTPGRGVQAVVQRAGADGGDADVIVGAAALFDEVSDDLRTWAREREEGGMTVVYAGRGKPVARGLLGAGTLDASAATRQPVAAEAAYAVSDQPKEGAGEAVAALRDLGMQVRLLTGDNARVAAAVAAEVGIDDTDAEVLPGDKADVIARLQSEGRVVAMVGDGVNDAPALAVADLGIAVGTGADVAREASDLTVVSGDPRAVLDAIRLSRRTFGTIRGNLFWAFAYNVAAIPLAAFGILNPMIAAGAMGFSSLFVVGNSLRLRRFTPRR